MAKAIKKWVIFKSNTIVPGDVVGEKTDQKMQVGKLVQLASDYADHLVQDGFAAFCDAPKKPAAVQPAARQANPDVAQKLADAEKAVDAARAHLESVAGTPDETAARAALIDAQSALAELQAP